MPNLPRREFLMRAAKYCPDRDTVGGWYVSEKLDGTRVFWDGGLSRGLPTIEVPYANIINPKTGDLKKKIKPIATGLWSLNSNPIIAPDWFLNQLPCMPMDGEIWAGRGNFQFSRSICAGNSPGPHWDKAEFAIFGCPPIDIVFSKGTVKNRHMKMNLLYSNIDLWIQRRDPGLLEDYVCLESAGHKISFDYELNVLNDALPTDGPIYLHRQKRLPVNVDEAAQAVEDELQIVLDRGGEGVVLRDPDSPWLPKRVPTLLKYKPFDDDEGILVGFTSGRKTDKGSKFLGKIGALILDYKGKRLELSGMTHKLREFTCSEMSEYAKKSPGVDMPNWFKAEHFKLGQEITFKYRGLSDDNIPKEARFWRKR